nr:hypothetical protein [Tanacetum cinerariifolium]
MIGKAYVPTILERTKFQAKNPERIHEMLHDLKKQLSSLKSPDLMNSLHYLCILHFKTDMTEHVGSSRDETKGVSASFINLGDCTQKTCCFFTDDVEESSPIKEVKTYSGRVQLYAIYLVHTGCSVGLMGRLEAENEGFKKLQSRMKEKM